MDRGEENEDGKNEGLSRSGEMVGHMNEGERRLRQASYKYRTPQSHLKTCRIYLNITHTHIYTQIFSERVCEAGG